jgi:hypothetical protein
VAQYNALNISILQQNVIEERAQKMSRTRTAIAAEFARRAKQFHPNKEPMTIELWGLFTWETISKYVKTGDIVPYPGYTKENKTIWCKPSQSFYDEHVKPLMKEDLKHLEAMAGW